ncbi:MAG: hypothetical protein M3082_12400 [Candidatus Dormibacteraeota bacterium]|nr:hypothetical protein [Candidatus Dormibacteraeota bacterium]
MSGVRDLWGAGKNISEIARLTGRDRKTVRRLVQGKAPGPRAPCMVSSKLDPFRDYLPQRLLQDKVGNAAILFDEIRHVWPEHLLGILASPAPTLLRSDQAFVQSRDHLDEGR